MAVEHLRVVLKLSCQWQLLQNVVFTIWQNMWQVILALVSAAVFILLPQQSTLNHLGTILSMADTAESSLQNMA